MRKSIEPKEYMPVDACDVFRHRFRIACEHDGISCANIATKLGVTRQAFSIALNGKRISLLFAVRVAKALDLSLDWLCGLSDE